MHRWPRTRFRNKGWDGARLAQLRKAAGYTQAELAEAMGGVTRRMIAYYETEAEHPPAAMLAALARALRVSVDELLGIEEIKVPCARTQPARDPASGED